MTIASSHWHDRKALLTRVQVALVLLGITLSWCALYCAACLAHWYSLAEFVPLMLYTSLAAAILLPLPIFFHATRQYFVATWMRVMLPLDLWPLPAAAQEVTWADFLLADMLCSLSKSSADFAQSMCHMATGRVMKELASPRHQDSELCRPVAPLLLLGLTYPYLVRFAQCLRVYSATRNTAQLFNAAKYCSSLPTLLLGAWAHEAHATGQGFSLHRAWLLASALNSAFSFYWDVEQDWDMPWLWAGLGPGRWRAPPPLVGPLDGLGHSWSFTAWRWLLPGLKPDALYRPRLWYAWALATNLVLRLAWLHRLILRLDLSPAFSLALGLAEAWRRYQWSFIRIETELRKLATKHGSSSLLPPAQPPAPATPATGSGLLLPSSLHPIGLGPAQYDGASVPGAATHARHVAAHTAPNQPLLGPLSDAHMQSNAQAQVSQRALPALPIQPDLPELRQRRHGLGGQETTGLRCPGEGPAKRYQDALIIDACGFRATTSSKNRNNVEIELISVLSAHT
ncbi:hypothetical protein QJQ45_000778 [Haematococcus lacustris]|nr:hypothetical protein QJQ45_000778 [Haematococcus lacustris]